MKPELSRRGREVPESPIRKLMPAANAAKARGVHVYHLNIGQPDIETPQPFRDRLHQIDDTVLAYPPSQGTPEYLETLVRYYSKLGIDLSPEQVIATTGGSEACLFAFLACANPGDEAIVVEPYYANYRSFATLAAVRLVAMTSRGEDGFHLPPREAWEAAVTKRTRLVVLCNPSNPTGTVYRPDELEMVAQLCRDHGLFLVCDEVYREFVYDGHESRSALSLPGFEDLVVVVDSLSKRYSACGIRLGSIVSRNPEVMDACLKMAQGRLAAPGLAQRIACGADELGPEYTEAIVTEYQKRRDVLHEGLSSIPGVFLRKPEGAFYLMPRLPIDDCEDFASWMLTDFEHEGATVMMAPAPGFYATPGLGRDEVRVAYVLNCDDLRAAVKVLAAGLDAYARARERAAS